MDNPPRKQDQLPKVLEPQQPKPMVTMQHQAPAPQMQANRVL